MSRVIVLGDDSTYSVGLNSVRFEAQNCLNQVAESLRDTIDDAVAKYYALQRDPSINQGPQETEISSGIFYSFRPRRFEG